MSIQLVRKGKHTSFVYPPSFPVKRKFKGEEFKVMFNNTWRYHIEGEDQYDWVKIGGITYAPLLNNHENTIMVGGRYNPEKDKIEINAYWHPRSYSSFDLNDFVEKVAPEDTTYTIQEATIAGKKAGRVYTSSVLDVPVEGYFYYSISSENTLTIKDQDYNTVYEVELPVVDSSRFYMPIDFYFGGSATAPQDIYLYKSAI